MADPKVNVGVGARYLRLLLDMFPGRTDLALASHDAGEGAVQRAGNKVPNYEETQDYVRAGLGLHAQLKPAGAVLRAGVGVPVGAGRVRVQLQGGLVGRGNLPDAGFGGAAVAPHGWAAAMNPINLVFEGITLLQAFCL